MEVALARTVLFSRSTRASPFSSASRSTKRAIGR